MKYVQYIVLAVILAALGVGITQVAHYVGDHTSGPRHFVEHPQSPQIPR